MATGTSRITGLLEGDDVLATAEAMRQLGAEVSNLGGGVWEVIGCGPGGLKTPARALDFANSGTGARLIMGVIAGAGISAEFTGDASLSRRPMARVTQPLAQTGAQIEDNGTGRLPLTITGSASPLPVDVTPEFASAQHERYTCDAAKPDQSNTSSAERTFPCAWRQINIASRPYSVRHGNRHKPHHWPIGRR